MTDERWVGGHVGHINIDIDEDGEDNGDDHDIDCTVSHCLGVSISKSVARYYAPYLMKASVKVCTCQYIHELFCSFSTVALGYCCCFR